MVMQASEIKILDQLLLVDLSGIHLWTARKKLDEKMLEGKLPPESLASLGTMRIIDPDKLKPFEKLKRQATKVLEENGVRFLGGYAVSQDRIQTVVDELDALKTQFYDLKDNSFIPNYNQYVSDWINKDWEKPEWRDAIKAAVTPRSYVESGMQFGYAACRVAPDGDSRLSSTLGSQVRGLADQLYAETAETAERLMETGLATRGHVSQTTLNTLRKINSKLQGLTFLSGDVRLLTQHIDEVLAALPKNGVVSGAEYNSVVTLVSSLSHEDSIKRLIKNLNSANGNAPAAVPEAAVPEVQPTPVPAEPQAVPEAEFEFELPPEAETLDEEQFVSIGDLILEHVAQEKAAEVVKAESPVKTEPEVKVTESIEEPESLNVDFW